MRFIKCFSFSITSGITADAQPYYDVDDVATDEYDLIVLDVQERLAGKYFAGFAISESKVEPELVVLCKFFSLI